MLRRVGRPGLLGTVARTAVVAGTASMTVNAVNRHAQSKAATQQEAAAYEAQQAAAAAPPPPPPPPAAAPAPAPSDLVSKLTDLAQLRDTGVLSQEEFNAAKAKLLES